MLLSNLLKQKAEGFVSKEKILTDEYDFVHQALFTDPDDQSGWFYHLWLMEQTVTRDSPWLVSSWPASDSEHLIYANKLTSGCMVSPFASYSFDGGTIPVILYFDQAVKGLNSSTVSIKSALTESVDIIWRPLSADKYESAHAWVALLKFSDVQLDYSITYPVEVSMGHSPQIISLSGGSLSNVFQFKFMVRFQQFDPEHAEGENIQAMSWEDSNFQRYEIDSGKLNFLSSFSELQIDKDQDSDTSKWQVDMLANEIELFRLLLSDADWYASSDGLESRTILLFWRLKKQSWCIFYMLILHVCVCSKIGKLTLARLLTALDTIMSHSSSLNSYKMVHTEEILALYSDLMKMDPPHSEYYKEEHSLAVLRQVCHYLIMLSRFQRG